MVSLNSSVLRVKQVQQVNHILSVCVETLLFQAFQKRGGRARVCCSNYAKEHPSLTSVYREERGEVALQLLSLYLLGACVLECRYRKSFSDPSLQAGNGREWLWVSTLAKQRSEM